MTTLFQDPHKLTEDARLLRQALRGGWKLEDATKAILMARLLKILEDPYATDRAVLGAGRLLVKMDEVNITRAVSGVEVAAVLGEESPLNETIEVEEDPKFFGNDVHAEAEPESDQVPEADAGSPSDPLPQADGAPGADSGGHSPT